MTRSLLTAPGADVSAWIHSDNVPLGLGSDAEFLGGRLNAGKFLGRDRTRSSDRSLAWVNTRRDLVRKHWA